ncbi:MAG: N-acetylneuraminate synthase [Deltaproteobacteria bacterium]|nr:MAG: N-acetylneuraminate synthase [Deltaproteobacteria bacterium]
MVKKTFIIAEAGVNHNGSLKTALKLVETAAKIGADAVKFQTFQANKLTSKKSHQSSLSKKTTSKSESQKDMISKLELSPSDHAALIKRCKKLGILFLSSPFDEESADLLFKLKIPIFKIPSGEITNKDLLQHIAKFNRPMILSTGMSTLKEVKQAVSWIQEIGYHHEEAKGRLGDLMNAVRWPRSARHDNFPHLTLLHCVTEYPAPFDQVNLKAMHTLSKNLKLSVGYSDHTPDIEIAIASVALGATVIEKHFTLDQSMPGPDHKASLEPHDFQKMIISIRRVEQALGDGIKRPVPCELANKNVARKSLVATRDLKAGTQLQSQDLVAKRPGTGIPPFMKEKIIGKVLRKKISTDDVLTWRHV